MPDQDPNQESDDRSILDAGDSAGGEGAAEKSSSVESAESEPEDPTPTSTTQEPNLDVNELRFEDDEIGEKLRHASEEQLNDAPFGIIQIDDDGVVEFFNRYESELSGMDPEDVTGRNFFTQVAPCTNNRLFRGRFKKGIRRGELDETFTYTYTYKMQPTLVDVHLYRDEAGNNWITVQKY